MRPSHVIPAIISLLLWSCTSPKQAQSMIDPGILNGSWEVTGLPGSNVMLDELYPEKKPTITFDVANLKISGNTGCNNFNGTYKVDGSVIDMTAPLGMTRMMCPGEGESTFVNTLQKVSGWTVRDETLRLMSGDLVAMHLKKIQP